MKYLKKASSIHGQVDLYWKMNRLFKSNVGPEKERLSTLYCFMGVFDKPYLVWDRELIDFLTEDGYNVFTNAG